MRILLADGRSQVRFALSALLKLRPGLTVVGEAASAEDLLAQAAAVCPDLLLLDWRLPNEKATDMLPALRRICPRAYVIALSARPEARQAALAAGVDAFVSKGDPPEQLLAAIDCYQSRSPNLEPNTGGAAVDGLVPPQKERRLP